MNALLRFSASLARAWSAVYTLGLPRGVRRDRRAELASDIWDQVHLASHDGESQVRTAAGILLRTVRGAPADVLWRLQTGRAGQMELALTSGVGLRAPVRRAQNSWFGRNGWVVPAGILLAVLAFMWWLMDSSRPSRLSFSIEAPVYLSVSEPEWELRARCCGRGAVWSWDNTQTVHLFRVTNHGDSAADVRIEGLERLPARFTYEYGQVADGSVEAHRAFEALSAAYRDRLSGAASFEAATAAFEANELRRFSEAHGAFFRAVIPDGPFAPQTEPRTTSEAWQLHDQWLHGLPEIPVCAGEGDSAGCIPHMTVPPAATVDFALVIKVPAGSEDGLIRDIALTLVDHAGP